MRLKPHLGKAIAPLGQQLLEMLGEDGRIAVAQVLEELFPMAKKASANTYLNRLRVALNTTASEQKIAFALMVSQAKHGGAENRFCWFEGGVSSPGLAHTGELDAIPPAQLLLGQRGLPLDGYPVVVLLTFNEYETRGVLQHFHPHATPLCETRDGITYDLLGLHGDMLVVHRVSKQGGRAAQGSTLDAWHAWRPKAVIAVGIAFGANQDKQRIGDVLVSDAIHDYEMARVNADGTYTRRGYTTPVSSVLQNRFNHVNHLRSIDPAAENWPTLHFGIILSGDKLVDNLEFRRKLLLLEPEAIGGEMEASGVQLAADRHNIDWIVVKAICDWGDGKKNSKSKPNDQKVAGEHAAQVVKAALDLGNLYQDTQTAATLTPAQRANSAIAMPTAGLPPSVRQMNFLDCEAIPPQRWLPGTEGMPISLLKDGEQSELPQARRAASQPDARQIAPTAGGASDSGGHGVEVLPHLLAWIDDANAPPLFALLGEYGMGKTVTCQKLAQLLDARLQKDSTQMLPLYFDLRNITGLDQRVPTLRQTLEECMERGWQNAERALVPAGQPPSPSPYTLENVLCWMDAGAVVIIDGLDEVLVKLKEQDGQIFTRNLFKLLADAQQRPTLRGRLRLLLSCRSQYFRTLRDQKNHFTEQERGKFGAEAYRALVLLPLSEEQVMGYLRGAAQDGTDPETLLATIRSVHNLEELTHRPYTLKLVAEFAPEIERDRMAGRTVYGVTLYRRMVRRWLERDSGKHHILPEHKMRLAAHLAAHLWRNSSGVLAVDALENWFHAWLDEQADIKRRYAKLHPEQLEEDLRTATFLTRQDDGAQGGGFRFAHTSLQEFFLADYLLQAVQANRVGDWAMRVPSAETLNFLGQMLAEAGDGLMQTLNQWRKKYCAQASELLLAYALAAKAKGWPGSVPILHGMCLRGAQLRGVRLVDGRLTEGELWCDQPRGEMFLDLRAADFSGADLCEALMIRVNLAGARFDGARLDRGMVLHCALEGAAFVGAALTGTIFRDCSLNGVDWRQAHGRRSQFLLCGLAQAPLEPGLRQAMVGNAAGGVGGREHGLADCGLDWLTSGGSVFSCGWSEDGARLIAGFGWQAPTVWDTDTGELLHRLRWHAANTPLLARPAAQTAQLIVDAERYLAAVGVGALQLDSDWFGNPCICAAGDGSWFAKSRDGFLRVWDGKGGELLHQIALPKDRAGYARQMMCADGSRVIAPCAGAGLQISDAKSGAPLLEVAESQGDFQTSWTAFSCSGDGARIATSKGNLLTLWDGNNGECLQRLDLATSHLFSCAWSGTSGHVAAGALDGGFWIADAATGQIRQRLAASGLRTISCAWSCDGSQLLSSSHDGKEQVWDAATGKRLDADAAKPARAASAAHDGRWRLDWQHKAEIAVRDAQTGALLHAFAGHPGEVRCAVWSPDGRQVLSAGADGTLLLWDAETAATIRVFAGHVLDVSFCDWSSDGRHIVSAGADGTLRLWDAASASQERVIDAHDGIVYCCAWSPDGSRLLSAGADGILKLWDAASGTLLRSHALSRHGHAVWSAQDIKPVIETSGDAWRYLAWRTHDEDGSLSRLPLECLPPRKP